jgi:hypothetical protein
VPVSSVATPSVYRADPIRVFQSPGNGGPGSTGAGCAGAGGAGRGKTPRPPPHPAPVDPVPPFPGDWNTRIGSARYTDGVATDDTGTDAPPRRPPRYAKRVTGRLPCDPTAANDRRSLEAAAEAVLHPGGEAA